MTDHNAGTVPPDFGRVVSQTPTTPQFSHPDYVRWAEMLGFTADTEPDPDGEWKWVDRNHRKVWEWVYILQAARQHGALQSGGRAVGFGVGNEPLPAALAAHGLSVIATDLMGPDAPDSVENWSTTGQLAERNRRPATAGHRCQRTRGRAHPDPIGRHERGAR